MTQAATDSQDADSNATDSQDTDSNEVGPTVGEIATPLDVLHEPPSEALLGGVDV